jgi:hypothetical protein
VVISSGYGPLTIEVDLSDYHGVLYFRTIASDALEHFPYWMEKSTVLYPNGEIVIADLEYWILNDTLFLGPGLVISRMDGLMSLDPYANRVEYKVFLSGEEVNSSSILLQWKQASWLDEKELKELTDLAMIQGFDPEDVDGAFYGEIDLGSEKNGRYALMIEVRGTVGLGGGEYTDFKETRELGPIQIGEEDRDGENRKEFPWALFIFLVVVAFLILIVTYLRYDSHWKDPEPDNDEERNNQQKRQSYSSILNERKRSREVIPPPQRTLRVIDRSRARKQKRESRNR